MELLMGHVVILIKTFIWCYLKYPDKTSLTVEIIFFNNSDIKYLMTYFCNFCYYLLAIICTANLIRENLDKL